MVINISTTAKEGLLQAYIRNADGEKILRLTNTDEQSVMLVPGRNYVFRWSVWSAHPALYTITISFDPEKSGFPHTITKEYKTPDEDAGIFQFTA